MEIILNCTSVDQHVLGYFVIIKLQVRKETTFLYGDIIVGNLLNAAFHFTSFL